MQSVVCMTMTRLVCRGGACVLRRSCGVLRGPSPFSLSSLQHTACATPCASAALRTAMRGYLNALWRLPPQELIPTHSPSGDPIDVDLFVRQVRDLFATLQTTRLVEDVQEMRSCPYFDSLFVSDCIFADNQTMYMMPKAGREHRSAEMSEMVRYLRGCGATGNIVHALQDVKGGRASAGDFLLTPQGVIMAYGTARTNKLCAAALANIEASTVTSNVKTTALYVSAIELDMESPPLADLVAFAGQRTLLVQDTPHGKLAAERVMEKISGLPWQVVKIEPGCNVLSHCGTLDCVYDVLCDEDFTKSMDNIGESGLNPFPVAWSEPRKLGITMRSVCLIARYARGTMSSGDYYNIRGRAASATSNYNSRTMASNPRLFANGRRIYSDCGAALASQIWSGELPTPVFQPTPRYAPPMHKPSGPPAPLK